MKAQEDFYAKISKIIEGYGEQKLLLGGDLNTYLDVKIDKKKGVNKNHNQNSQKI